MSAAQIAQIRAELIAAMRRDSRARLAVAEGLAAPEERRTLEAALGDGAVSAVQAGRVAQVLAGARVGPDVSRRRDALNRLAWALALDSADKRGRRQEERWRAWAVSVAEAWRLPAEDLELDALEAAVQAALRWDPMRAPYGAYARAWVKKALWRRVAVELAHRRALGLLRELAADDHVALSEARIDARARLRRLALLPAPPLAVPVNQEVSVPCRHAAAGS